MSDYLVTEYELTSIADTIRSKTGSSNSILFPSGYRSAISDITTPEEINLTKFKTDKVQCAIENQTVAYHSSVTITYGKTLLYAYVGKVKVLISDRYNIPYTLNTSVSYVRGTNNGIIVTITFTNDTDTKGIVLNNAHFYISLEYYADVVLTKRTTAKQQCAIENQTVAYNSSITMTYGETLEYVPVGDVKVLISDKYNIPYTLNMSVSYVRGTNNGIIVTITFTNDTVTKGIVLNNAYFYISLEYYSE